jgi:hypothetical protein
MSTDDQRPAEPSLSAQDAQALDRLLEHGLGTNDPNSECEQRLQDLLGLLGARVAGESHRDARADLIEILARRIEREEVGDARLSNADAQACDLYFDGSHDLPTASEDVRSRAAQLEAIGSMITGRGQFADSRERLVSETLSGIQSHINAEESAMKFQPRGGFQLPGRWADLVSVAAMLLLAASVIMPIMSGMRSINQKEICYNNMNQTASAFGLYTGANRDMLPMATAGFGPTWMDVGTTPERSNSSNLYTLIRNQFIGLDELACPSNPKAARGEADPNAWDWKSLEELSYSYRIMPQGGMRTTSVDRPVRVVLLSDRSPVILRIKANEPVRPEENSPNHDFAGQHMLMLDGSAKWSDTPVLESRDNIWLPRPIESVIHQVRERYGIISGNEQPDGPTDAFVGP